jgi:hypothetical protein
MKIIRHNCGKNKFDMKDILLNTMTMISLGFDRAEQFLYRFASPIPELN